MYLSRTPTIRTGQPCAPATLRLLRPPICLQQNQILKPLRPQEALEEQTVVNTRYDLSRPGKYTIQAQLANDPRTFIEVPRKFRYGSQGLELDDKVNGASRATVKSNRVTLTIEPAPQP